MRLADVSTGQAIRRNGCESMCAADVGQHILRNKAETISMHTQTEIGGNGWELS